MTLIQQKCKGDIFWLVKRELYAPDMHPESHPLIPDDPSTGVSRMPEPPSLPATPVSPSKLPRRPEVN